MTQQLIDSISYSLHLTAFYNFVDHTRLRDFLNVIKFDGLKFLEFGDNIVEFYVQHIDDKIAILSEENWMFIIDSKESFDTIYYDMFKEYVN